MRNLYTKTKNGLWLKSLLFTLLTCFFAFNANAQDVDFGKLELDKEYAIKGDFVAYKGYFTAPESGTLTASATYGCLLLPYNDALGTSQPEYNHSYLDNGEALTLEVKKGETYHFYLDFAMETGTFKLSMSKGSTIEFVNSVPSNGSVFDLSEGGLISVKFTQPVAINTAMISCNQTMTEVDYTLQSENIVFDLKNRIYGLMENGNLKGGDTFALILDGVHAAGNENTILGEDGTLVLTYTLAEMPIALDSTINVENNPFLSYWLEEDSTGIITLLFDGELQSSETRASAGIATITCGELEAGVGGFYHEEVPYTVSGNALTINLTGKLRRQSDMLSVDMPLEFVTIKVKDIRGANGKLAYFPGKGGLGSYTFDMPYKEVNADPTSEFTPGTDTQLNDIDVLEIWVTDYKTLQHDGILFASGKDSVIVNDFEAIADTEYEGAYILNVKVPEAMKAAKGDVTVSFLNLKCIDGLDHNADLSATFSVATGIETVIGDSKAEGIYQMNGVKVNGKKLNELSSGLYIINGKKVIVCNK